MSYQEKSAENLKNQNVKTQNKLYLEPNMTYDVGLNIKVVIDTFSSAKNKKCVLAILNLSKANEFLSSISKML